MQNVGKKLEHLETQVEPMHYIWANKHLDISYIKPQWDIPYDHEFHFRKMEIYIHTKIYYEYS